MVALEHASVLVSVWVDERSFSTGFSFLVQFASVLTHSAEHAELCGADLQLASYSLPAQSSVDSVCSWAEVCEQGRVVHKEAWHAFLSNAVGASFVAEDLEHLADVSFPAEEGEDDGCNNR